MALGWLIILVVNSLSPSLLILMNSNKEKHETKHFSNWLVTSEYILKKNWLIHSFGWSVIQPWFFFSLTNCTIIQFYKALAIHEPSSSACKNSNQNNKYKWYSLIPVIFGPQGLFLICLSLYCSLFKRFFIQKLWLVPEDFLCHHDTIISVVSSIYHRAT